MKKYTGPAKPIDTHSELITDRGERIIFLLLAIFMAPVLGVAFRSAASAPLLAAGLLLAYGVGHCSILVGAGSAVGSTRSVSMNKSAPSNEANTPNPSKAQYDFC